MRHMKHFGTKVRNAVTDTHDMKKTPVSRPLAARSSARTEWMPLATALLGIGIGVSGTLAFQHWKASDASSQAQSSTRLRDEDVPDALKGIVPPFAKSPAADRQTTAQMTLSQGNTLYDARNWSQAALQYEQAIAGGLDNADVRTDLGNCYRFLDQPQKALEQYQRAQKENPQHEQSLFNQGGLYAFSLKDNARAIAKWREYLQRFPQGATVAEARKLIAQAQSGQLPQTDASTTNKP